MIYLDVWWAATTVMHLFVPLMLDSAVQQSTLVVHLVMFNGNCDREGEEENWKLAGAPGRQYKPHDG